MAQAALPFQMPAAICREYDWDIKMNAKRDEGTNPAKISARMGLFRSIPDVLLFAVMSFCKGEEQARFMHTNLMLHHILLNGNRRGDWVWRAAWKWSSWRMFEAIADVERDRDETFISSPAVEVMCVRDASLCQVLAMANRGWFRQIRELHVSRITAEVTSLLSLSRLTHLHLQVHPIHEHDFEKVDLPNSLISIEVVSSESKEALWADGIRLNLHKLPASLERIVGLSIDCWTLTQVAALRTKSKSRRAKAKPARSKKVNTEVQNVLYGVLPSRRTKPLHTLSLDSVQWPIGFRELALDLRSSHFWDTFRNQHEGVETALSADYLLKRRSVVSSALSLRLPDTLTCLQVHSLNGFTLPKNLARVSLSSVRTCLDLTPASPWPASLTEICIGQLTGAEALPEIKIWPPSLSVLKLGSIHNLDDDGSFRTRWFGLRNLVWPSSLRRIECHNAEPSLWYLKPEKDFSADWFSKRITVRNWATQKHVVVFEPAW